MPEYLAPAVYVEEVDTGSKPIEGVSTSTAGMIGLTERGPVNVPILVTAVSEYQRWFGQYLDPAVFDAGRCYLPHAIDGFFTNGGKRAFVTRVLDPAAAAPANRTLVAPDTSTPASTQLLASAPADATSVIVIDGTGFAPNDMIQIGTGTGAEFRTINAPLTNASVLALRLPLSFEHAVPPLPALPPNVQLYDVSDNNTAGEKHDSTLQTTTAVGDTTLTLVDALNPALAADDLLRIGTASADAEYIRVAAFTAATNTVTLRSALQLPHLASSQVHRQTAQAHAPATTTQMAASASSGDSTVVVANTTGLTTAGNFLFFDHPDPTRVEYRDVGSLARVSFAQPAYADYPVGSRVEVVTLGASSDFDLTADAAVGATVVTVSNRSTMNIGDVIRVGTAPEEDYAEIAALPAPTPGNNPGAVVLQSALRFPHTAAVGAVRRYAPPTTVTFSTTLAVNTAVDARSLIVSAAGPIADTNVIRVSPRGGTASYQIVTGAPAALTARSIPLDLELTLPEPAGAPVVKRTPMIEVRALDAGGWGDRLQVGAEVQLQSLLTTAVRVKVSSTSLRLNSAAGVESGTELVITDAANVDHAVKVQQIDRQNDYLITLEPTTPLPAAIAVGNSVRSREYRFVVELLRQPDPANPLRNNTAIDREVFTGLSLDPRHSRYLERVIGTTWDITNPTVTADDGGRALRKSDRRSEGEFGVHPRERSGSLQRIARRARRRV